MKCPAIWRHPNRKELSESTRDNWNGTRRHLKKYFGEAYELQAVTEGKADAWRQYLVNLGYAQATIAGCVKRARQFFRYCIRNGLIQANPFAEVKAGTQANTERQVFVSQEIIKKAIKAAPDVEWRLIIALCRYGGLRCPSEVLKLEWSHIDWEGQRFTVTSPKTKKQGKPYRVVPLVPELQEYLAQAFDQAEEGARFCITRYRDPEQNLRTTFLRILRKAGLEPWTKPFQNLRSSRETELAKEHPIHVVTAWLGNTPKVAEKHYLQVTDEDFAKATGGAQVVQMLVQQPSAEEKQETAYLEKQQRLASENTAFPEAFQQDQAPRNEPSSLPFSLFQSA